MSNLEFTNAKNGTKKEIGRPRSGSDSNTNSRAATGLRTRPTFRDVIMEALGIKYVGVVMNPLVRKLLHEELERIVPQIIDQTASAVSQQMRVELERMVPHFFHEITRLVHQQVQGELQNEVSQIIPQIQHVVGQQMDRLISHTSQSLRSPIPHIEEATQAPNLQLVFVKELLQPIYADDDIKDMDNNDIQVFLQQIEHGQSSIFSQESSIQLEVVVLDGKFPQENITDWNADEFNRHILVERENKRPLLVGTPKATLHGGMAYFGALRITDNSSWVKSRKFRLGVRVSPESCVRQRIKEAISECVVVLDHRGKCNESEGIPPSLDDEVWRLENVGRNGEIKRRLADAGIKTVQDLLMLSVVNLQRLRDIVKMTSKRAFNKTLEHARTCEMGDDHYILKNQRFTLILNPICEVVGVQNLDGSTPSFEQGSPQLKEMQELAYKNWKNLEKIHGMPQTNTIRSREQIDSVRGGELEPHNWNNSDTAIYDAHHNPVIGAGKSAFVPGQLPQLPQMGNAQNPVAMETVPNYNNWTEMAWSNSDRPHNLHDPVSVSENSIFAFFDDLLNNPDHQLPPQQGNAEEAWNNQFG